MDDYSDDLVYELRREGGINCLSAASYIEELEAKYDALTDVVRQRDVRIEELVQWHDALEAENEKLRKGLEIYERERNRYKHAYPEMTGAYFLSCGHGPRDDNQMPQFVEVVPAYGCGWSVLYEKTDRTISYEGS